MQRARYDSSCMLTEGCVCRAEVLSGVRRSPSCRPVGISELLFRVNPTSLCCGIPSGLHGLSFFFFNGVFLFRYIKKAELKLRDWFYGSVFIKCKGHWRRFVVVLSRSWESAACYFGEVTHSLTGKINRMPASPTS